MMRRRAVEFSQDPMCQGKGQAAAVKFHQAFHSRKCGKLVGSDGSGSTLKAGSDFFCYTTWCFGMRRNDEAIKRYRETHQMCF